MARSSVVDDEVFVEERDRGGDNTADDDDDAAAAAAATTLLLPPATRRSMVVVADAKRRDIARSSGRLGMEVAEQAVSTFGLRRRIKGRQNGREGTSVSSESFDQKSNGQNSPQDKATMGEPSTRLVHL